MFIQIKKDFVMATSGKFGVYTVDGKKNKEVTATELQSKNQTTVNCGVEIL